MLLPKSPLSPSVRSRGFPLLRDGTAYPPQLRVSPQSRPPHRCCGTSPPTPGADSLSSGELRYQHRTSHSAYVDSNHVRPRQLSSPSAGSGSTAHEYGNFLFRSHRSRENDRPFSEWPTPTPRSSDGSSDTLSRLAQAYSSRDPSFHAKEGYVPHR